MILGPGKLRDAGWPHVNTFDLFHDPAPKEDIINKTKNDHEKKREDRKTTDRVTRSKLSQQTQHNEVGLMKKRRRSTTGGIKTSGTSKRAPWIF